MFLFLFLGIWTLLASLCWSYQPIHKIERPSWFLKGSVHDRDKFKDILRQMEVPAPERSELSVLSSSLGWLLSHNLPQLFDDMSELDRVELRPSFGLVLDFLEMNALETRALVSTHQLVLKKLLQAAQISESTLQEFLSKEGPQVTSPGFLTYLESEVEAQSSDGPARATLQVIQMMVLEELGRSRGQGEDILAIPRLASEASEELIRLKVDMNLWFLID